MNEMHTKPTFQNENIGDIGNHSKNTTTGNQTKVIINVFAFHVNDAALNTLIKTLESIKWLLQKTRK